MPNFEVQIAKNNPSENTDVAFYIEVKQSGNVILGCFSTEVDPTSATPLRVGITAGFDQSLATTVTYKNLGKKVNNINVTGVNYDGFNVFSSGNPACASGEQQSITFGSQSGSFGLLLKVNCNEVSQTLSGVDFQPTGTPVGGVAPNIGSVKPSDNTWVSVLTPNIIKNPYYASGTPVSLLPKPTLIADVNNPNTGLKFNTPSGTGGNISTKTVELHDSHGLVSTITFTGTSYTWANLASESYKIRYSTSSSSEPISQFSDVVTLASVTSQIPIISHADATLNSAGTAQILVTGISGATIKVFVGGLFDQSTVLGNTGAYSFTVGSVGDYRLSQTEAGKTESALTALVHISAYVVATPSCLIGGVFTVSNITFVAGVLQFAYVAQYLTAASYQIKQGTSIVKSGTVAPSNNNPQISIGSLADGNYSFELTGTSCTGTASGTFTVGTPATQEVDTYTITVGNACGVLPGNIQTGTSATNDGSTVTDWVDGVIVVHDLSVTTRSGFAFIRDKNNHVVMSAGVPITT